MNIGERIVQKKGALIPMTVVGILDMEAAIDLGLVKVEELDKHPNDRVLVCQSDKPMPKYSRWETEKIVKEPIANEDSNEMFAFLEGIKQNKEIQNLYIDLVYSAVPKISFFYFPESTVDLVYD